MFLLPLDIIKMLIISAPWVKVGVFNKHIQSNGRNQADKYDGLHIFCHKIFRAIPSADAVIE